MKTTLCKVLAALALVGMAGIANAQSEVSPGRSMVTSFIPVFSADNSAAGLSKGPVKGGGGGPARPMTGQPAYAEAVTPDIQALAANLNNDPVRIYNFVHDEIRHVFYYGSKKGATLTLLERSGNDFDQCALLSALLTAAGYSPGYQFGLLEMPYDAPNHQDLHHWLGLSLLNTNWSNTVNYFSYLMGTRGYPLLGTSGTNTFIFQRIWVTLSWGGTNYVLDPAFKDSEPIASSLNLTSAMGLSPGALWTNAGGSDNGTTVSNLNESSLRAGLQACNSNLQVYLSNNLPDASVAQVIGGQQIVSSTGLPLATSLAFTNYTAGGVYPLLTWTVQPTNFMSAFTVSLGGTNQFWYMPQLEGQRLSLTFDSNGLAQLWQDDSLLLQTTNTGTSNTLNVVFSATHPYGTWSTSSNIPVDSGTYDRSSTNVYQRTNASYAIIYAFEANPAWLHERQQKLDTYQQEGLPGTSRQVTTETLNVMGLGWMVQTELAYELLCQEWGQLPQNHHRFGRMGQEQGSGYYVDAYLETDGTLPATGANSSDFINRYEAFDVSSYVLSAMEHGIIEQLQNSNLVGASTVKMLEIAATNAQPIYLTSSANWSSVAGNLTNYSAATSNTLNTLIVSNGYIILLPQNGSNFVAGAGSWAGDAYVELQVLSNGSHFMSTKIGGGYNGGYDSSAGATPNPTYITTVGNNQQGFFNPQSSTLPVPPVFGADPVNLADGSFQISATDLSLGQKEPRGLNLTRYYSSARRTSNPAGMAPGWLHSYYGNVVPNSDPIGGLGGGTAAQMTPMIVATWAALNFYTNQGTLDAKNWTVTALIAKWGIDQLTGNSVSVNLGKDTLQFLRQPDGSYTPPGNCTMSLLPQTNGTYWLQERHGRTFKFSTNNVLTSIVDPYSQLMTLAYNSNNLVTNVTDSKGRSLSFTYSGGVLSSVSDSSSRSVSYGYTTNGTGQFDLTSYTDPESKTSGFTYDTNHQVIATSDALSHVVVSNIYNGFGQVITQYSQGNTNKAWQIFASGYYTVQTDPNGGQQVYTYDSKSRLIAFQDAVGNVTQTFYDGQDHVVQTISPLNETNQFFYDTSNNLIERIDPLGFSNVFHFDSQNNLTATFDPRGNSNTFTYNTNFSVLTSTNGAGNGFALTYNTNGAIATHLDPGGTTTYGYDSYGQLISAVYPGSLGTELFLNSAAGDVLTHTNARSMVTTFQYNQRRQLTNTTGPTNLTVSLAYDAVGNLLTATDARGNSVNNTWSATRHLTGTTFPSTPQGSPVVINIYDNRDWLAETLNPLSQPTYLVNNAAQQMIAVADALSRTNTFKYDPDSHPTNSVDAASETNAQRFDARGETIKLTDAAGGIVGKTFDAAGNLTYLTNRNTNVWQFQYDAANRLTNTISPTGKTTGKVFNNRGLLQSVKDAMSQTTTFSYDARGRMTNRMDNAGTNGYQHDLNNNETAVTDTGRGIGLSWGYDAYDRPIASTNAAGYVIKYGYDNNGNLTSLIYPGNLTVSYAYDNLNRVTTVTDWASRVTTNTYDLAGELTNTTRPNGTTRTAAYDADGEMTNIVERYTAGVMAIDYLALSWSNSGRMQWEFLAPLPHAYTPPSRTMTYDADNRLTNVNGNSLTVDADGNMTYGPGTNSTFLTYSYNARNQLTGAGGITYGYDPAGNRTLMTNGSVITTNVIDPRTSQLLMRIRAGATNYYVYGAGLLYEIDVTATTTNTLYYHYDSRGSTIALTDGNGNITDRMEYAVYGMTTYRSGTTDTPFLYNGRYGVQSDPNGLLFMRARYYNPYICRFLNADPSGFGGGLNMYAFADGNPVSEMDPFGLNTAGEFSNSTGLISENTMLNVGVSINPNVFPSTLAYQNPGSPTYIAPAPYYDPSLPSTLNVQNLNDTGMGMDVIRGVVLAGINAAPFLLPELGGEALAADSTALTPMADAALQTGTIRNVAGYELGGNAGLAGNTYNVNLWALYETQGSQGPFALINALKGEASAAGANQISITGSAVVNQDLLNIPPAIANRLGLQFQQINSTTILLQGAIH